MSNFLRKLTSRKLWLALAGVAAGLAMALGVEVSDLSAVAGAVTAAASVVSYIVTEGKLDAERVKTAVENIQQAADALAKQEK
jgi:ABC-type nickel/cobalt efflux system permease component RcnA